MKITLLKNYRKQETIRRIDLETLANMIGGCEEMEEVRRLDADRAQLKAMEKASLSIAPVDATDIIYNTVTQTCR